MQCSLCSKAQTYNYNANTMPNFSSKPRDLRSTWTQYEATIGIQKPHAKPLKKYFIMNETKRAFGVLEGTHARPQHFCFAHLTLSL